MNLLSVVQIILCCDYKQEVQSVEKDYNIRRY